MGKMSLLHRWVCTEGSGDIVSDSVGSLNFVPSSGDAVKWGYGSVLGVDRYFLALAHSYRQFIDNPSDGVDGSLVATWADGNLTTWTIGVVFRRLCKNVTGAFFRSESGTMRIRSNLDGTIDATNSNVEILSQAQTPYGEWGVMIISCNGSAISVYLDDMSSTISTIGSSATIANGVIRLLTFSDTDFPGSCEIADLFIANHVYDESERNVYRAEFGNNPLTYSWYNRGDNFGGFFRFDEYVIDSNYDSKLYIGDIDGSTVTLGSSNGNTCQFAYLQYLLNTTFTEIWTEMDYYFPSNFVANHDFGPYINIFSLYSNTFSFGNDILVWELDHTTGTEFIDLGRLHYRNTTGETIVNLPGTEVTKGVWHKFKMHISFTAGTIDLYFDDNIIHQIDSLTLDIVPNITEWGMDSGAHPEQVDPKIAMRNFYIGQDEYTGNLIPVLNNNNNIFRRMLIGG